MTITDEELFGRYLAGDRSAFERLLERREGALLRQATATLRDTERAQDVVQEAFMRLLRHGAAVDSVPGWLSTVTRNLCHDHVRRRTRMSRRESVYSRERSGTVGTPDKPLIEDETAHQVREAIEGLSEKQRTLLTLKVWDGLTYREISGKTGMTVSNVAYHISQAMQSLSATLAAAGVIGQEA